MRREDDPIAKHTLNLYAGDYARLQALYSTRLGAAKIIRDLVRNHIRDIERAARARAGHVTDLSINLEPSTAEGPTTESP